MWSERIKETEELRIRQRMGGGSARIEKQHAKGKMTALERIAYLLDEESFHSMDSFFESRRDDASLLERAYLGDGVVTGWGMVHGRRVCVAAEDFTVVGGTLGEVHASKICHIQDLAYDMRVPLILLNDSGGARIEEGILSLSGYGGMFQRHVRASGVIPQIAAILGPCSGGACYSPALCDFVFIVNGLSKMCLTGPAVVESVLGIRTTLDELGGTEVHGKKSGVAQVVCEDERACLDGIRTLLAYLPQNCGADALQELRRAHAIGTRAAWQETCADVRDRAKMQEELEGGTQLRQGGCAKGLEYNPDSEGQKRKVALDRFSQGVYSDNSMWNLNSAVQQSANAERCKWKVSLEDQQSAGAENWKRHANLQEQQQREGTESRKWNVNPEDRQSTGAESGNRSTGYEERKQDAKPEELRGMPYCHEIDEILRVQRLSRKRQPFEELVPDNSRRAYDVLEVINNILGNCSFYEIYRDFAPNVVTGFGIFDSQVLGIVANQPMQLGGSIDCDAADKMARFIRFCDCFGIPLLTLVDVPAFFPGPEQERQGIIRHGAKILYAYSEATVPKVTLILRKAYGGAFIAMNSKLMGADVVYAWPVAEIAVMGAEGAVRIIDRRRIAEAEDPQQEMERLKQEYEAKFSNPFLAARKGYIDEVILPEETVPRLRETFRLLGSKMHATDGRRHGNMPM